MHKLTFIVTQFVVIDGICYKCYHLSSLANSICPKAEEEKAMRFANVIRIALLCAFLVPFYGCSGCGHVRPGHADQRKSHKKLYGKLYKGSDGKYYVRSHHAGSRDDVNDYFVWWILITDSSNSSGPLGSGSWARIETPPVNPTATGQVVAEEENGTPTEEIERASDVPSDEVVTEETTEAEVDAVESEPAGGDEASPSDASPGDSGGDSGDGGGGDGGGSD